jgi:hypothetical protein
MRTGRIFERAAQKSDTCTVGIATSAPPAAIAYTGPMKTKSHGTAFAHPVAPLMWKSGTCHFVDGSCRLCGASGRDVKIL